MSQLIDLIHALLCKNTHTYDMLEMLNRVEGTCYYYLESDAEHPEKQPDHINWNIVTEHLKDELALSTDEDALTFIVTALRAIQDIRKVTGTNKKRIKFIKKLMADSEAKVLKEA